MSHLPKEDEPSPQIHPFEYKPNATPLESSEKYSKNSSVETGLTQNITSVQPATSVQTQASIPVSTPQTAAYVQRSLAQTSFQNLRPDTALARSFTSNKIYTTVNGGESESTDKIGTLFSSTDPSRAIPSNPISQTETNQNEASLIVGDSPPQSSITPISTDDLAFFHNIDSSKDESSVVSTPRTASSTIEVLSSAATEIHNSKEMLAPLPIKEPKTSSRRVKNYLLADGSTVSGKGLGRGRPGVKRGPRSLSDAMSETNSPQPISPTPILPKPTVHLSPSTKRKRADSDLSIINNPEYKSTSVTSASRESSIEYNPTSTQTRSGRQSHKPPSLITQTSEMSSPSVKKPKVETTTPNTKSSPSNPKMHPKIKRRIYRGRESLALCEHCLRGNGPQGNVIVFCDACNKCWHQKCHDPQVSKEIVADSKAQWFCSECDRILHGSKKTKKQPSNSVSSTITNANVSPIMPKPSPPTYSGPLIGGATLKRDQKVAYLNSLSKDKLINLILNSSDLAPALPLFQMQTVQPPPIPTYTSPAQFTSNYVTPVSKPPDFGNSTTTEPLDEYFDEFAALYPKPGNGVKLPPESVDMHMLLEGRDSRTFSHWVRGMPGREYSGTSSVITVKA